MLPRLTGWLVLAITYPGHAQVNANQTIVVNGEYSTQMFNPETGKPQIDTARRFEFKVELREKSWIICATNVNDSSEWATLAYDGTNTYSQTYYNGRFATTDPNKRLVFATVSPTAHYGSSVEDKVSLFFPWLVYGFSPGTEHTNARGIIDMPLPWAVTRVSPEAFGFKWLPILAPDRNFFRKIQFVRDSSLDLDEKAELLRPQLDYVEKVSEKNVSKNLVAFRQLYPNGKIRGQYECLAWYNTNALTIPKEAIFEIFSAYGSINPIFKAKLGVSNVMLAGHPIESEMKPANATIKVRDYRYKMTNETRIYKYSEYLLQPGDSWRLANDPVLLARAKQHLEHGRKYDDFENDRNYLAWVVGLVLAVLLLGIMLKWRKRTQTNKTL